MNKAAPSQPLYLGIKKDIKRQIDSGELGAGEKIPSLKVISEKYGVSSITAVRVLRELNKERYARHERGKGYFVPDLQDRTQRRRLHGVVGVVMRPYSPITRYDNYINEVISGIQNRTMMLKYDSLHPGAASVMAEWILTAQGYASLERGILHIARSVDGLILDERVPDEMVRDLRKKLSLPMVMIVRECEVDGVVSVPAAYKSGARRAMELALRSGYEQFILCLGNQELPWLKEAGEAVRKFFSEHNIARDNIVDSVDCHTPPWTRSEAEVLSHVRQRSALGKTLVIGNSDSVARVVCDSLGKDGLVAGTHYGLIGFGGTDHATFKSPHIASVKTRPVRIGELAVDNLMHVLGRSEEPECNRDAGFDIAMGDTF